jgi:hypothetical protein
LRSFSHFTKGVGSSAGAGLPAPREFFFRALLVGVLEAAAIASSTAPGLRARRSCVIGARASVAVRNGVWLVSSLAGDFPAVDLFCRPDVTVEDRCMSASHYKKRAGSVGNLSGR